MPRGSTNWWNSGYIAVRIWISNVFVLDVRSSTSAVNFQGTMDTATFPIKPRKCGRYVQSGEIRFYCANRADAPNGIGTGIVPGRAGAAPSPAGFRAREAGVGRPLCETSAGILPRTRNEPPFWSSPPVEGGGRRLFVVNTECCPGNTRQSGNASARP